MIAVLAGFQQRFDLLERPAAQPVLRDVRDPALALRIGTAGEALTLEKAGDFDAALEAYVTLAATYPKSPLISSVMIRISEYFYKAEDFVVAAQVGDRIQATVVSTSGGITLSRALVRGSGATLACVDWPSVIGQRVRP